MQLITPPAAFTSPPSKFLTADGQVTTTTHDVLSWVHAAHSVSNATNRKLMLLDQSSPPALHSFDCLPARLISHASKRVRRLSQRVLLNLARALNKVAAFLHVAANPCILSAG
jgi:hypothetical protein